MNVIKRDATEMPFDKNKIKTAILKAMTYGSGIVKPKIAEDIANEFSRDEHHSFLSSSDVQDLCFIDTHAVHL